MIAINMAQFQSKKKVLFAITKSNFGGAQRYVFDIARLIDQETTDVAVACGGRGTLTHNLEHVGIRTIEIRGLMRDVRLISDFKAFVSFIQILRRERPDILHLNSSKMGLIGAIAGRICGVPRIIFTAHGWPFNENRSWLSRVVFMFFARVTIHLSHHTIVVSDALAHDIDPSHRIKKISTIHNGIESRETLTQHEARNALVSSYRDGEFWVGTIAELHPVKGLSVAIEAFQKYVQMYPNSRYVIIGEGDEREALEKKIKSLGLENKVLLTGFRSNASTYLCAFDVFVLPSLSEGLSYAILEAGSANLPVIASSVGGIPEIVEDGVSGILVAPNNIDALTHGLERLSIDRAYRESVARALKSRVEKFFSLKEMFEKTTALYELD